MRESNNQNFKYCLYGAVAIVAETMEELTRIIEEVRVRLQSSQL